MTDTSTEQLALAQLKGMTELRDAAKAELAAEKAKYPVALKQRDEAIASLKAYKDAALHTVDGVQIRPGMTIYDRTGDSSRITETVVAEITENNSIRVLETEQLVGGHKGIVFTHRDDRIRWWVCYSTPEAAKAAAEKAEHKEPKT